MFFLYFFCYVSRLGSSKVILSVNKIRETLLFLISFAPRVVFNSFFCFDSCYKPLTILWPDSRYISRSTWFMFFTEEWWMFFHKDTHFFLAHNLAIFLKTQVVMKWRWEQKGPKMKQINESQGGISRTCCL